MVFFASARSECITPERSFPLDGYPHCERLASGVDTDLFTSALYFESGSERWLIISHDLLMLDKSHVSSLRSRISKMTGVPGQCIMVTCSHTHSAPVTRVKFPMYSDEKHPAGDPGLMDWLLERAAQNAVAAVRESKPAELGFGLADSSMVGGNRRKADGPSHPQVPVFMARELDGGAPIGVLMVVAVHPTVLHEDSFLYSADYPGYARLYIQSKLGNIPVLHLNGPSGDQSPRHVARGNTVCETKRLGSMLGESVLSAIEEADFVSPRVLRGCVRCVDLPLRAIPPLDEAVRREREARIRLDALRKEASDEPAIRTAECDWFGSERALVMARMYDSGELEKGVRALALPAELQVLQIDRWFLAAWPGEAFVDFALELRRCFPQAYVVTCANGMTQGYLVTHKAVTEGGYEADSGVFQSPESGDLLVSETAGMIRALQQEGVA